MTSPADLTAALALINAAREQTHTNIEVAQGWAELAQAAAGASGSGSAQSAAADANRAEQARTLAVASRTDAEIARSAAETAKGLAESARTAAQSAAATVATAVTNLKAEILGGVGPAFDTLAELKAAYESADTSLTALIGGKADKTDPRFTDARTPTTHTQAISTVTGLEAALDGKASSGHTHTPASLGAVTRGGSITDVWGGTLTQYNALPAGTRNAAGFFAVILP